MSAQQFPAGYLWAARIMVLAFLLYCDRDIAPVFGHLSPLAGIPHR